MRTPEQLIAEWREQTTYTPGDMYSDGRATAFARCADELELSLKAHGLASPALAAQQEPALNHEGEPLHTGDDDRIDCVTAIRAALEQMSDTNCGLHSCSEVDDLLPSIVEECDKLDTLLLQTIQRERLASPALAASPPQWQPIETAPKDGTMVMVYPVRARCRREKPPVSMGYWHQPWNPEASGFWVCAFGHKRGCLTHWQPLPDPPSPVAGAPDQAP
jgi:hypothetical protein